MVFLIAAHINNDPKIILSHLEKKIGFLNAPQLEYRIYLLGVLPIGKAVLNPEQIEEFKRAKVYHLNATAQTLKGISVFFNASAELNSYIDVKQKRPLLFKQTIRLTGKQTIDKQVLYDQEQSIMTVSGIRRSILTDTQDPLSAMFNIRKFDFDTVRDFEMNINTNHKNYILKGTCEQEELSLHKKIYKIIFTKATIKRRDKNPYHQSSLTMVLLKESGREHIPLLINVFAGGVLIKARLTDIK